MFTLAIILTLFCLLHLGFRSKPRYQRVVIAHRGAGGLAPENTLAGIKVALQQQAPLVEVDLRRSQDGVLLLLHDRTVDRTTNGTGAVHTLPWSTIEQLDAGSHFAPDFAGAPIPPLETVLAFVKGQPTTLVIELKDTALYPGIEQALVEMLRRYEMREQTLVISFDRAPLAALRQLMPDLRQGLLTIYPINLDDLDDLDATISHADTKLISIFWPSVICDPTLLHRLHKRGYRVWVWTVNQRWQMRLLGWLGVDGITTDRPDWAETWSD